MQANWVMDRNRMVGDSRPPIDDYIVVDLSVRKLLANSFELGLTSTICLMGMLREPAQLGANAIYSK